MVERCCDLPLGDVDEQLVTETVLSDSDEPRGPQPRVEERVERMDERLWRDPPLGQDLLSYGARLFDPGEPCLHERRSGLIHLGVITNDVEPEFQLGHVSGQRQCGGAPVLRAGAAAPGDLDVQSRHVGVRVLGVNDRRHRPQTIQSDGAHEDLL